MVEALESRRLLNAAGPIATTTQLSFLANLVDPGQTVVAEVAVTAVDPEAGPVTGSVAFLTAASLSGGLFDPPPHESDIYLLRDSATSTSPYSYATLLGTAPLDGNGQATLTINNLSPGAHTIEAIYLGATQLFTPSSNFDGILSGPSFAGLNGPMTVPMQAQSNYLVYTNGMAMQTFMHQQSFSSSDVANEITFVQPGSGDASAPAIFDEEYRSAYTDPNTGVLGGGPQHPTYFTPPVSVAPSDLPLWEHVAFTDASTDLYTDYVYHYDVEPAGPLPPVAGENDAFETSQSSADATVVTANVVNVGLLQWQPTLTNQPKVVVSINDPLAGSPTAPVFSRAEPITVPGDYLSASISVTVQGSGGGGSTSGGGLIIGPGPGYGPVPTGTVTLYEGDNVLATLPMDDYGNAVWQAPDGFFGLGPHELHATYSGDQNYAGGHSLPNDFTITQTPTWVGLTTSAPISIDSTYQFVHGDTFTLTAKVTTQVPDFVTPSGSVIFMEGDNVLAGAQLGSNQVVQLNLPIGSHQIRANYSGDENCLASSGTITVNIVSTPSIQVRLNMLGVPTFSNPSAMLVNLWSSGGDLYSGQGSAFVAPGAIQHVGAVLNATVNPSGVSGSTEFSTAFGSNSGGDNGFFQPFLPQGAVPTGSVDIFDGNQLVTTVPLDSYGSAMWYPAPGTFALGSHSIHAVYSGDAFYAGGTSDPSSFNVTHTPTILKLPNLYYLPPGKSKLDFEVQTRDRDTVTPSGTVTFTEKGKVLAVCNLGTTTSATWKLSRGKHTVTATYSGDANCLGDTQAVSFQVAPVPTSTVLRMPDQATRTANPLALMPQVYFYGAPDAPPAPLQVWIDGRRIKGAHIGALVDFGPRLRNGVHWVRARYAGNSQVRGSDSGQYKMRVQNGVIVSLDEVYTGPGGF